MSEAFTEVETALREKIGACRSLYGKRLIDAAFYGNRVLRLKTPYGPEDQKKAQDFFRAVFGYLRNEAAHDGRLINETTSLRALYFASECLDLLDTSQESLEGVRGLEGFAKKYAFQSPEEVLDLLRLLRGCWGPEDEVLNSIGEELGTNGFDQKQLDAVFTHSLMEFVSSSLPLDQQDEWTGDSVAGFELTPLGEQLLGEKGGTAVACELPF